MKKRNRQTITCLSYTLSYIFSCLWTIHKVTYMWLVNLSKVHLLSERFTVFIVFPMFWPHESCSRKMSCGLNVIYTFFLIQLLKVYRYMYTNPIVWYSLKSEERNIQPDNNDIVYKYKLTHHITLSMFKFFVDKNLFFFNFIDQPFA